MPEKSATPDSTISRRRFHQRARSKARFQPHDAPCLQLCGCRRTRRVVPISQAGASLCRATWDAASVLPCRNSTSALGRRRNPPREYDHREAKPNAESWCCRAEARRPDRPLCAGQKGDKRSSRLAIHPNERLRPEDRDNRPVHIDVPWRLAADAPRPGQLKLTPRPSRDKNRKRLSLLIDNASHRIVLVIIA